MTISERLLRRWRKEALQESILAEKDADLVVSMIRKETSEKILAMTSELLDQHLLRK